MTDYRPFKASSRKLQDAKKRGYVPRSRELNTFFICLGSVLTIWLLAKPIFQSLHHILLHAFSTPKPTNPILTQTLFAAIQEIRWIFITLFLITASLTLLGPLLMGGFQFTLTHLQPTWQRLSFQQGMQRLLSPNSGIELGKALVKIVVLLMVAGTLLTYRMPDLLRLAHQPTHTAIQNCLGDIIMAILILTSSLALFALVDVPIQLWRYQQSLRMSPQELKEEQKITEGNPQTKQRIRKQQLEVAQNRMMLEVPKATVIITSHIGHAIALRYDAESEHAPRVVAKGIGNIAEQIRYHALANQIPQVSAPELAKSLYFHAPLYREVPKGLFTAVAKILTYTQDLVRYQQQRGPEPTQPRELEIPESLQKR